MKVQAAVLNFLIGGSYSYFIGLKSLKRSCAKVMFSQACQEFCPRGMGVYPSMHWGRQSPWADTRLGRQPPWADTPIWADIPWANTPG